MANVKYWVTELSESAQKMLHTIVYTNLKNEGYDMETAEMKEYMKDIQNEKLSNLDMHVTYEEMVNLSNM